MMKLYLIAVLFAATLMVVHSQAVAGLVMTENEATSFSKKSPEDEVPEGTGLTDDQDSEEHNEKRALRNRLSGFSCRQLYLHGFCKYGFIRVRCALACSCGNKLSLVSCKLVKNRYRTCNALIGRFYCKTTCGHCGNRVPPMCRRGKYSSLNDITRRQSRPKRIVKCDSGFKKGWYRFIGNSGKQMPTKCVPKNRCGTHAPGWLRGGHPGKYQIVSRTVCFNWSNKCCNWSRKIRVVNCGGFFLYELVKTPVCSLRYCGDA